MRLLPAVFLLVPLVVPARASASEPPDPALGILTGAGTMIAGLVVGGALVATNHGHYEQTNAGWLSIQASFALAPLAAHAAVGEWGRGALFAAVPAAALGGTATLFGLVPGVVEGGTLPQQRWMWALFVAGLFGSAVGVADSIFAPGRAQSLIVAPTLGWDLVGLQLGGSL